ncbi:MAG: beta strand repeat-containing protein [Novosphingobium sp.]
MTKITKIKFALLGATALFAATSAHAQVANTWEITGDVNVTATNNSTSGILVDGTDGNFVDGANVQDGYKNSISAAAVGASASQSFTAFNASNAGSTASGTYDGNITVTAGNIDTVGNVNSLTGEPTIAAGQGNSISLAAVGASASGGATFSAANATADNVFSLTIGGTTTVQVGDGTTVGDDATGDAGGNAGAISVSLGAIDTPTITTGNANSISAAGVGASASFGLTFNTGGVGGDSTIATETSIGDLLTVTATNTADGSVTISSDGTDAGDQAVVNTALISGGTNNSISVATVGSSGSVSVADNVYGAGSGSTGTIDFSDIAVNTLNEGTITNKTLLDDGPTIDGSGTSLNTLNSISVAGVGTSASVGFSVTDYSGDGSGVSTAALTAGQIDIVANNLGQVTVSTGLVTPTINGGLQNSISAAAVGASASQSISHTVLPPIG